MAGLAFSAAPILGGLLLEQDLWGLSWRSVFLINLPVGVPALAAGTVLLSESRAERRPPLDLGGVAIVTTGLLLVLFPLIQGNDLGWPAWTAATVGRRPGRARRDEAAEPVMA